MLLIVDFVLTDPPLLNCDSLRFDCHQPQRRDTTAENSNGESRVVGRNRERKGVAFDSGLQKHASDSSNTLVVPRHNSKKVPRSMF